MPEEAGRGGLSEQEFDQRKRKIAIDLFEQTRIFMETDGQLNRAVIELVQAVTANIKANPKLFESQSSATIDDLIKQMQSVTGQTDKTGGDITGGGILNDIADFIHSIGDFIKGEKEFIFQIIRLIFCGCK